MPKFNQAFYLGADGITWVEIKAAELKTNPDKIALCKSLELRDSKEGAIILFARKHAQTPHFYSQGTDRKPLGGEVKGETEAHKELCAEITGDLQAATTVEIGYYYFVGRDRDPELEVLHTLTNYRWKKPGHLDLASERRYIPDVVGRSPEIDWVDRLPIVAIEVVDTHFSDWATFEVQVISSAHLPLYVGFMFCSTYRKACHVKPNWKDRTKVMLRTGYYIFDGSFWVDGERFEERPGYVSTGELVDYYQKIDAFLRDKKLIRVG